MTRDAASTSTRDPAVRVESARRAKYELTRNGHEVRYHEVPDELTLPETMNWTANVVRSVGSFYTSGVWSGEDYDDKRKILAMMVSDAI